ncbi:MAG: sigma 54-interacting transcriptional regulator, partial [Desulfopila sp.]|nr:sigma 54-interacting transcriptional regulator [Desulfopila sp.]
MNTIITLQYKLTAGTPEYNPYVLDFSTAAFFEQLKVNQHPVCLVVSGRDLASLKEQSYLINYLGEKKKAIQLTRYFNRPQKHTVPLLACNYSNEGRLAIGIKALLSHIEKNGGPGIVMLSVSPVIFDTLLRLAEGWMTGQIIPLGEDLAVDNLGCGNNEDDTHSLLSRLSEIREPHDLKDKYIGMAKAVQLVRKRIVNAAHCDLPVLIIGDNGTGKEIVARQIHEIGKDQKHPFCPINCGAISKEILEVELFGCEANVTGPQYPARTGLWQAAGEGTLFLDEIGDLSLDHQAKILRALQEKKIRRVGSNREVHAPARIIAATNKNLLSMTLNGQFRYDLYSRLNQMRIETPALRDHLEDLGIIAQALWQKTCTNENAHLSDDILDYLKRYNWPGNVRELKSLLGCCYATFKRIQPELRKIKDAFILQGYDIHHLNRAVVQL